MTAATRFSIAVHILTLLEGEGISTPTSEWMACSIGVNPVTVRNVTGMLRRAGLVRTRQGVAGTQLGRPLARITLLDVYRAVEEQHELFPIHSRPNPACPIGAHMQAALEGFFTSAQEAMEAQLASSDLQEVLDDVLSRAGHSYSNSNPPTEHRSGHSHTSRG